jgi:Fic family protein
MPDELQKLIDAAKRRPFPDSEREAQRRSFAYGNTKIENPRITRETVNQQAEKLKSQANTR